MYLSSSLWWRKKKIYRNELVCTRISQSRWYDISNTFFFFFLIKILAMSDINIIFVWKWLWRLQYRSQFLYPWQLNSQFWLCMKYWANHNMLYIIAWAPEAHFRILISVPQSLHFEKVQKVTCDYNVNAFIKFPFPVCGMLYIHHCL